MADVRLIDANELIKQIVNTPSEAAHKAWERGIHTFTETLNCLVERQHEIIDMVSEAPTINPEDYRPRGRWIEQEDGMGDTYYDCSICGESFCLIDGTPTDNLYNYCPSCGAKMDREEQGDA